MEDHVPENSYQEQLSKQQQILARLLKRRSVFGWLRLLTVVATFFICYYAFGQSILAGSLLLLAGIALFLFEISKDVDNNKEIEATQTLIAINEEELAVLQYNYATRFDGAQYLPPDHSFGGDLDVFGKFSLYQFINRGYSEQGRGLLAHDFLHAVAVDEIGQRHEAIKELAPQLEWRQNLQSLSVQTPVTIATQHKIEQWLQSKEEAFTASYWKFLLPLYSLATMSMVVAAIFGYLSSSQFGFIFLLLFFFSSVLSRKPTKIYFHLSGVVKEVSTLKTLISWIEGKTFASSLLSGWQHSIAHDTKASVEIKKLEEVLNRFELRLNVFVFIFLNSLFLWDVWQMRTLNEWRRRNKAMLPQCFDLIAKFEVINSLTVLHFNQPAWCLPTFKNDYFSFEGKDLGHPLIPGKQRVVSDFAMNGKGQIALITGSNMAGKSTFLRSLGVNTILAQMGAPACATALQLSRVELICSMRISDNLAENTSTFYAELKKLKTVIDAANLHRPVFILLDEILRGTNSLDRHIGSKALIRQLVKQDAVAVIATHDLELANIKDTLPNAIDNYHFDVQVANGDELYFDYKLKEGVCTSLNASILMRKIGIELV
jgi:ABC-type Na+ transport system ATPase subunit NatA